MWKRKLQFSASLLRRGGATSLPPPSPPSKINQDYRLFISQFSTYNSSFLELKQKSFDFFIWGFKNPRIQLNLLCAQSFCSESGKFSCWNCGGAAFLFCEACRSVQPVDQSVDYFQILGLEKKYDIEEANLERKYKDWQKKLHPDLVHTKSQLKLEGVIADEEERISDPELLSEIMEIREAVEEARDTQTLNQIQAQMQKELGNWSRFFADAFQSRNYDKALTSIQRMTYYKRAIEEVIKKL